MTKIKITLCAVFAVLAAIGFAGRSTTSRAQTIAIPSPTPDVVAVTSFDKTIQKRFLTNPGFGTARFVFLPTSPKPLESGHMRSFSPQNPEEASAVTSFTQGGWEVGMYLYGRWVNREDGDKKFKIQYRANLPVAVTPGLKVAELPKARKLADEVKQAFLEFQKDPTLGPKTFIRGKWTMTAAPVRVANQSCIECHADQVITDKLSDGKFTFRKKQVGDVNGILVYAFRQLKP